MTRPLLPSLSALLLIGAAALVSASSDVRVQSVEQQKWLNDRDRQRATEIERQRVLGLHEAKRHGDDELHFSSLLVPAIPALIVGTILLVYWLYLTMHSRRRPHFN